VLGPVICLAIWAAPTPAGLSAPGQSALAVLALCVCWWLFAPVALPVTSLVGLALLPVLGALPTQEALALFGNPAVFFVIGVFLVAVVLSRTGLSARVSLQGLRRCSGSENSLCIGVMTLSWGLCFVVVSHAVAAILLPVVLELIRALDLSPRSRTARRLLLSMAWGTVAGSNLTLLSSARATLALQLYGDYLEAGGLSPDPIGFVAYTAGSVPVSLVSLLVGMAVLRISLPPEGLDIAPAVARLDDKVRKLGPLSTAEKRTAATVLAMVLTMVLAGPDWLGIVALVFSGLLFLLQVLRWEDAEREVNWGVALMYGGAIAVGGALYRTGATEWLAAALLPEQVGPTSAMVLVGLLSAAFTEVVSNAAVIAVVLPVALPLGAEAGLDGHVLAWAVPLSAGFAFLLPTSTPAMAMVFGTGYLRMRDTLPGLLITAVSLAALVFCSLTVWPLLGLAGGAP
jgi:anion transporter